jgi:hypothetical protein
MAKVLHDETRLPGSTMTNKQLLKAIAKTKGNGFGGAMLLAAYRHAAKIRGLI